ncbi:MAG: ATP-grasp domain-containing protein [Deltaproteobacteria bacterium]|nr:ATP-grasp domain-containing protein [Deltaproteobacteria bacterium]
MAAPFNVLISSAGRRVALLRTFRGALAELGLEGRLLAVDISRASAAFHDADLGLQVPRCDSAEFIPAMLEICRAHEVRLVVPTLDPELLPYAAHRAEFAAIGTTVAISSPQVVAIGSDKVQTHAWLSSQGFPAPRQALPEDVLAAPDDWPWPLIVKPVRGSSSIGVARVETPSALRMAARAGDHIVQTCAPGKEYTVSVYVDHHGRCQCAVPRRRLEVRAGEVQKGMAVRAPAVQALARDIAERLPGAYGVLNVQIFWDEATGALTVIELNARFGGGYPLAWEAGARYSRWLIEDLLGLPSTASWDAWRDGLVMLRYDDAVFVSRDDAGVGPLD